MEKQKAIAYYRVSTQKQGVSGLGLEAQRAAVLQLAGGQFNVMKEFTDIESGKNSERPELLAAIDACKKEKATLLIAKLDRLSRKVSFISAFMESRVDFKAADQPTANRFMFHLLAAFAENEREQISQRTKDALQAAKRRGVKLGTPERDRLAITMKKRADNAARAMKPTLKKLKAEGITSVRSIAAATGKNPSQIQRIIKRLKTL